MRIRTLVDYLDFRPIMRVVLPLLLAQAASYASVTVVYAATTISVTTTADELNNDGDCSLREALTAANHDAPVDACPAGHGADLIVLAAATLYTLNTVDNTADGANGLPSITSVMTIEGQGATVARAGSANDFRIFHVAAGDLTLRQVNVRNGRATGTDQMYADDGGGIFVSPAGTVTLNASVVADNWADFLGGGISNDGSLMIEGQSEITHNSAMDGGGIFNGAHGTLTVRNSTLLGNGASFGGGVFNDNGGVATLQHSLITNNAATNWGGGVASASFGGGADLGTTLTIEGSTLTGNTASSGGGVYRNTGNATITTSVLYQNTGHEGGGLYNHIGALTLSNSTLSGNHATGDGGGIFNLGTLTLLNDTLTANRANGSGGGLFTAPAATTQLRNTLVANNPAGGGCLGPVSDAGNNLQFPGSSCGASIPSADPRLGPLADNGGPTLTHALLADSAAIDAGDDTVCAAAPIAGFDQRGALRSHGVHCEIGAYEAGQPTLLVSASLNGRIGSLVYRDEDILAYHPRTQTWSLFFDGSDVGLGNTDVDAFALLPTGHLLISTDTDFTLRGFGAVDDADILEFAPSSLGSTTRGGFSRYFDGSDVELSAAGEDVDAIDFGVQDKLRISVVGAFNAPGPAGTLTGQDEDLFRFREFSLGEQTSGLFTPIFDGTDVGLTTASEDVRDTWTDNNDDLYLVTLGTFQVSGGVRGDGNDILLCQPTSLGEQTSCQFSRYWDGGSAGLGTNGIDGLHLGTVPGLVGAAAVDLEELSLLDDSVEVPGDDADAPDELDGTEATGSDEATEMAQTQHVYLPLVAR